MENTSDNNQKNLQQQLFDSDKSTVQRYQELQLGTTSLWYLIKYELIMLTTSWVPGALGLVLRKLFYPKLLAHVGKNVVFGSGVTLRHGQKISIADNVIVDDGVALDAKGADKNGIQIGEGVIVSRYSTLSCKGGGITIGNGCTLGIGMVIHGMTGSDVVLGNDVLVGAYTYLIGGDGYNHTDIHIPFKKQGALSKGGIRIADNVWMGSHVKVLDGVAIGSGTIIGNSALVNKSIPGLKVVAGIPAKVLRSRDA